jgi:hypothetical protein
MATSAVTGAGNSAAPGVIGSNDPNSSQNQADALLNQFFQQLYDVLSALKADDSGKGSDEHHKAAASNESNATSGHHASGHHKVVPLSDALVNPPNPVPVSAAPPNPFGPPTPPTPPNPFDPSDDAVALISSLVPPGGNSTNGGNGTPNAPDDAVALNSSLVPPGGNSTNGGNAPHPEV